MQSPVRRVVREGMWQDHLTWPSRLEHSESLIKTHFNPGGVSLPRTARPTTHIISARGLYDQAPHQLSLLLNLASLTWLSATNTPADVALFSFIGHIRHCCCPAAVDGAAAPVAVPSAVWLWSEKVALGGTIRGDQGHLAR